MFRHKANRGCCPLAMEALEHRRLLTCDFREADALPGDANMDCYIDEADLIQVAKYGKYQTGESAIWEEGDWDGDGVYDGNDLMTILQSTGHFYRQGSYDENAGDPISHLTPVGTADPADVTIFYFPESGNVTVVASGDNKIGAMHLVSQSSSINPDGRGLGPGPFDRVTNDEQFVFSTNPSGWSWIEFVRLLPRGWTNEQVTNDLLVDGGMAGGGDLGTVHVGNRDDLPNEVPDDTLIVAPPILPNFVDRDEANGLLTYDPATGDIFVETWDLPIEAVELISPDGLFVGTIGAEDRFIERAFDEAIPERLFRLSWDFDGVSGHFPTGYLTISFPGVAQTGLTEAEFFDGVHPRGGLDPPLGAIRGEALNLALAVGPTFAECKTHLANGEIVGDANLDGRFDSGDLVAIFQAGEYDDEEPDNSTWGEGDWTCDGDFDTGDLVAAFQTGRFEAPAAALPILAFDDPSASWSRGTEPERPDDVSGHLAVASPVGRPKLLEAGIVDVTAHVEFISAPRVRPEATDQVMAEPDAFLLEQVRGSPFRSLSIL